MSTCRLYSDFQRRQYISQRRSPPPGGAWSAGALLGMLLAESDDRCQPRGDAFNRAMKEIDVPAPEHRGREDQCRQAQVVPAEQPSFDQYSRVRLVWRLTGRTIPRPPSSHVSARRSLSTLTGSRTIKRAGKKTGRTKPAPYRLPPQRPSPRKHGQQHIKQAGWKPARRGSTKERRYPPEFASGRGRSGRAPVAASERGVA